MKKCQRCHVVDTTVAKSRILPPDVEPTTKCGCAMLCWPCRQVGIAYRLSLD
jgi:hypothetical protein